MLIPRLSVMGGFRAAHVSSEAGNAIDKVLTCVDVSWLRWNKPTRHLRRQVMLIQIETSPFIPIMRNLRPSSQTDNKTV